MTTHHSGHHSEIEEAARLWAVRVADPRFDDWDGFTRWLEAGPEHPAAYDAAVDAVQWGTALLANEDKTPTGDDQAPPPVIPAPANDRTDDDRVDDDRADDDRHSAGSIIGALPASPGRRRWLALGGAIAAGIALFGGWTSYTGWHREQIIATGPGQKRTVALADGSRIRMNGATRLALNERDPRHIRLDYGEALFEVVHDERAPFTVMVGNTRLLDAGTVFNVIGKDGALEVAVAEGAVIYQPGSRQIRLGAGDALSRADGRARPALLRTDPAMVGSWKNGLLHFDDAPMDKVARDIGRTLGQRIDMAGDMGQMRFTGTLAMEGTAEDVLMRAAPLLGVQFRRIDDGHQRGQQREARTPKEWRMTPAE